MARSTAAALTLAALAWLLLIVVTPIAAAHGQRVGPAIVYQAAGLVCHQRPERSFHLDGVQLPVCARCFGLYLSGAVGALLAWSVAAARLARTTVAAPRLPLAAAAIPTAATVALEWAGLAYPSGLARAVASLPLGLLGGFLIVRLLAESRRSAGTPVQVRYHA